MKPLAKTNKANSLPYNFYFISAVILTLLGIVDAGYLTASHYKNYTDITYSSFCAISQALNCDTVSQSPWSIFFGLPIAIWGLLGYIFYFSLLLSTYNKRQLFIWNLLFLLTGVYSLLAIYFGYISISKIKSQCILCLFSYTITLSLFFLSWLVLRRFECSYFYIGLKQTLRAIFTLKTNLVLKVTLLCIALSLICLQLFLPSYWKHTFPPPSNTESGITEDGSPWIGSNNPLITIEEFTDYQCFQCKKTHYMLRQLIAKYPGKIKLIHYHFPMDHTVNEIIVPTPFHIGSGKMSFLAIYSAYKEKFWEMNDLLFKLGELQQPFNLNTVAAKTGIPAEELAQAIHNKNVHALLRNDIRRGMKLGITGTPSFVIEGKVYTGAIPTEILKKISQ